MEEVVERIKLLDGKKLRRDVREILIAALASGAIAAALVWVVEPWFRIWIAMLSISAALIAVWRYVSLFRRQRATPSDSLADHCREELRRLEIQIRLSRNLTWWYLVPMLLGTNLYVIATSEALVTTMTIVFPITFGVVAAIYWANRRSLRLHLLPLRGELQRCVAALCPPIS